MLYAQISKKLCEYLGPPLIRMIGYKSSPGVWIFDCTSGITWVIFSDGYKNNPWKGTSYELVIPDGVSNIDVLDSAKAFFGEIVLPFAKP